MDNSIRNHPHLINVPTQRQPEASRCGLGCGAPVPPAPAPSYPLLFGNMLSVDFAPQGWMPTPPSTGYPAFNPQSRGGPVPRSASPSGWGSGQAMQQMFAQPTQFGFQYGGNGNDAQLSFGSPYSDLSLQMGRRGHDLQVFVGAGGSDTAVQRGGRGDDRQIALGGHGDDRIVQRGGKGDDVQSVRAGAGDDTVVVRGGRGHDRARVRGGAGDDRFVYKVGRGDDVATFKGGKGQDTAVIRVGDKDVTIVNEKGEILFTQGQGGDVVTLKGVEKIRVLDADNKNIYDGQ
jgi:Ca2+-binding RTX toxin-like protein